jgi:hypothetical protein
VKYPRLVLVMRVFTIVASLAVIIYSAVQLLS